MKIRILAKNNYEKGRLFEQFIKKLLDKLGFIKFKMNVKKEGREIDIHADHKVLNSPIICECKGYERPLTGTHLSKFFGIYYADYSKNKKLKGLMFSLSGFSGGLQDYYDKIQKNIRERFRIYSGDDIYNFLVDADLIKRKEVVEADLKNRISYKIKEIYLAITEYGECWVVLFGIDSKLSHFTIIPADDRKEVERYEFEELQALSKQLRNLRPIDTKVRSSVILSLCDLNKKSPFDISKEIQQSQVDIELALNILKTEGIVVQEDEKFSLSSELEIFVSLCKDYLSTQELKISFLGSKYAQEMINQRFIEYIMHRFHLVLEVDETTIKAFIRIFQVSPAALLSALTASTENFKNTYEDIVRLKFSGKNKKKATGLILNSLQNLVTSSLMIDLENNNITDLLSNKGIIGYKITSSAKLATKHELHLDVCCPKVIALLKVKKGVVIKGGQFVKAANPEGHFDYAQLHCVLGDHKHAIESYDLAIKESKKAKTIAGAWNNKGLIYQDLKDDKNALKCYRKAVVENKKCKEAYCNMGRLLLKQGKRKDALKSIKRSLGIDRKYSNAKKLLEEVSGLAPQATSTLEKSQK